MNRLRARWFVALALIVGGLLVGLLGAFLYSLTEQKEYRARVALIAQRGVQPVAGGVRRTLKNLVLTDIVAQNVIRNQQLDESSSAFFQRLHVHSNGSVISIDVDDADPDRATRVAQELSLVYQQLVRDRFGTGADSAQVAIWDPAHGIGQVSPRVARDLGWGALFGALLGLLAANVFVLRGRRGVWQPIPVPYDDLPSLGAGAYALPAAPEYLGNDDGQIADSLIARAGDEPFQTVLVAGDPDARLTAGVAQALAERGELTMWVRADDADSAELDRLAARCSFVLVAAPAFDPGLAESVDAVVAVTDGAAVPAWPGVRLIGTVQG